MAALLPLEALLLYNWVSLWHGVRLCVTCISHTFASVCPSGSQPSSQAARHSTFVPERYGRVAYQLLHTCVHNTYLACHNATATALEAPLLYTSTRLLIQVATGAMDDSPCCRLTGAHHGKCTHGPVLGQHVYSILKRADKASGYSPLACTLHASYAMQAMHVLVPLPPEKMNRQHYAMVWFPRASKFITYIEAKCL